MFLCCALTHRTGFLSLSQVCEKKTAKQMFFYESNIFQLMRRTNRRPLLLRLFPHRDITACNKVLMSSRGHAVKLTIWRSLADSSWLAGSTQLCGETITNIVPVNYTEVVVVGGGGGGGGGVWLQMQLWSLFWLHCNSEAQSWLPANNWLYWELTLPTPSCLLFSQK